MSLSRTTIYFLTQADGLDEAETQVSDYLESEDFYSYYTVLPDQSGPLVDKRKELLNFVKDYNWKNTADDFLRLAQKFKEKGDLDFYGQNLISAGELFAQHLTISTYVFNVESDDYSIPDEDASWWVIKVDFRY